MPNLTRSVLGSGVIKSGGASITGPSASTIGFTGTTSPAVLSRLAAIRALLKTMGVNDISKLGTLTVNGNVLVQGGLTTPPPVVVGGGGAVGGGVVSAAGVGGFLGARVVAPPVAPAPGDTAPPVTFSSARQLSKLAGGAIRVRSLAGTATPLPAVRLPQFERHSPPLSIFDAIWVATTINLADGTNVILVPPGAGNLLILAQKIVIGNGVNFTWQRQPASWQPAKSDTPAGQAASPPVAPAAQTTHVTGTTGTPGSSFSATPGGNGFSGAPGPDIEIWTLDISGALNLDLAGQDGQPGGRGQDGQPGGPGGAGGPSDSGFLCKYGPASGGSWRPRGPRG
jgi:hypothetical protein